MPLDLGPRHYSGPEQPKAPPMPSLPPAEELLGQQTFEDEPSAPTPTPVSVAFYKWFDQRQADDNNPTGVMKIGGILEEAFLAGWQAATAQAPQVRPTDLPLEGTVESRTIVAALEMFKEQVLAGDPPEVQSGEWLNAKDVDVLIQGIRANAAKGR